MTTGFLLALAAAFVWSIGNIIDKTVVGKLIRNPIYLIVIYSIMALLIGFIMLPFFPASGIGWKWIWIFWYAFFSVLGNLLYFYALKKEEASRISPLFSLAIVFVVVLSAIFLGEVFSLRTYFGIFVIISGSVLIMSRRNFFSTFTSRALWLMIFSSLGFAIAMVITKYLLETYSYWQVFGWQRIAVGLVGPLFTLFFISEIKQTFRQIKGRSVLVAGSSEIFNVTGTLFFTIACAYWFVSLVETTISVQYIFVFGWALLISRFRPTLFREETDRRTVLQKVSSIALIILGIYLIT